MSEANYTIECIEDTSGEECALTCQGLAACNECGCALLPADGGGPWGNAADVIFCLLPIIFLVVATVKPNPLPTTVSLPLSAVFMYLVRLMYLGSDPLLSSAAIVLGVHEAWTPLTIMAGAMCLFETMEATNCMPYMLRELKELTNGHPAAELSLIFSFAYMVEGASGFGTPVALGAPMLVSMGNPPLESVVILLLMNTFATVWGAVGTPIWFGFGSLDDVGDEEFQEISYKAGVALCFGALFLLPKIFNILVPWKVIKESWLFIVLGLGVCVGSSLGIAFISFEFPALLGGMVGVLLNTILIHFKVGLKPYERAPEEKDPLELGSVSEHSVVRRYHKSISAVSDVTTDSKLRTIREDQDLPERSDNGDFDDNVKAETAVSFAQPVIVEENEDSLPNKENDERDAVEIVGASDKVEESGETPQAFENGERADVPENGDILPNDSNSDTQSLQSFEDKDLSAMSSQREAIDHHLGPRKEMGKEYVKELTLRTSPIWLSVVLLILTRLEPVGLKDLLTRTEPSFSIYFGTYGTFKLSASLVFQLENILTWPNLNWKYELLYIPFIMPFVLVSLFTMFIYRKQLVVPPRTIFSTVFSRLKNPFISLTGALILVQLMIEGDQTAPATIIGTVLSDAFKGGFIAISAFLGILGSFFSGSTTVSNLTFGEVQLIAAESIGTSETAMLALQAAGASAGNGVCLNNIIAACTVVGLAVGEGQIVLRTWMYVFAHAIISTIVMLAFFFRF